MKKMINYTKNTNDKKLKKNKAFLDEAGYMVMTKYCHKKRGYCCGSKCKNCPYDPSYIKGNKNLKKYK